jgi:hypothetical protein
MEEWFDPVPVKFSGRQTVPDGEDRCAFLPLSGCFF